MRRGAGSLRYDEKLGLQVKRVRGCAFRAAAENVRARWFWRKSAWQPFLLPSKGGFLAARLSPETRNTTKDLLDHPGVYEFALVKRISSPKRYKVYAGQTGSLRRRLHFDYRTIQGSHLRPFFDEALKNGCEVWWRSEYVADAEAARRKEAQLLRRFDYAWNVRQAGCEARHVDVRRRQGCCGAGPHLVSKPAGGRAIVELSATGPLAAGVPAQPQPLGGGKGPGRAKSYQPVPS